MLSVNGDAGEAGRSGLPARCELRLGLPPLLPMPEHLYLRHATTALEQIESATWK